MKTFRIDLTVLGAFLAVLVAVVVLSLNGQDVPPWLAGLGATLLAGGIGAAVPSRVALSRENNADGSAVLELDAGVVPPAQSDPEGDGRADAATVHQLVDAPAVPTPRPGRDWTETFPAITREQIDADFEAHR